MINDSKKRNNKKGFTLVELIISVMLLAIIGLTIGLNLNKVFKNNKISDYDSFVGKVIGATDVYISRNTSYKTLLETNKGFLKVTVKDLKEAGLLETDLTKPNTGEKIGDSEYVLVAFDAAGVIKFTYPVKEEDMEEYLQTLNKYVKFGATYKCLEDEDLDSVKLGLIDKAGDLVKNYFKNNPSKITCDDSKVDSTKLGTYVVKYTYENQDGQWKEATRHIVVLDDIPPQIDASYSPTDWTRDDVTITATFTDNESGIAEHSINKGSCGTYTESTATSATKVVSENGRYYVCAKDSSGNTYSIILDIWNIDKVAPTIGNINPSTADWTESLTISFNLYDDITANGSGVVAYAINQTTNESAVSWTTISPVTSFDVTHTFSGSTSSRGIYYIWAKDRVGNVSYKSYNVDKLGRIMTGTYTSGEVRNQPFSASFSASGAVQKIVSATPNTSGYSGGYISSTSFSGSSINFSISGGSRFTQYYQSTCNENASYTARNSNTYCASYICPSGGNLSGTMCTGKTWTGIGYNYYKCDSGKWGYTGATGIVNCSLGYYKTYNCPDIRGTSCPTNGATTSVTCTGTCNWQGNYPATCTKQQTDYSCPSGYTMVGTGCYRCNQGSLSGTTCNYSCTLSYQYYRYSVTFTYFV